MDKFFNELYGGLFGVEDKLTMINEELWSYVSCDKPPAEKIKVIERYLNLGANINTANSSKFSVLHAAAKQDVTIVNFLLEKGANAKAQDQFGCTPLHRAARYGTKLVVEALLKNGAVVDAKTIDGYTPLHAAVRSERTDIVVLLLEHKADVRAKTSNGITPLHEAVRFGNTHIVNLLLDRDADINVETVKGYTPLHEAAHCGRIVMVDLLLSKGAVVKRQSKKGYSPLHEVARYKDTSYRKRLMTDYEDVYTEFQNAEKLHEAGRSDLGAVGKRLISEGADVDVKTVDGETPLHTAAYFGEKTIINLLLDNCADINSKREDGMTPLHMTISSAHKETTTANSVVELLLRRGSDVNLKDKEGKTPLNFAIKLGSKSIVEQLLQKHHIDVNSQDLYRNTPLHEAVRSMDTNVVELLLEKKSKTNIQNIDGHTPLHEAVCLGAETIVKKLLSEGAKPFIPAKNGKTSLDYAVQYNHQSILKQWLKTGAKFSKQKRTTLLYWAVRCGNTYLVKFILKKYTKANKTRKKLLNNTVHFGSTTVLKLGTSVNKHNRYENTLLHEAVRSRNMSMIKLLLNKRVKVNKLNIKGNGSLHDALRVGITDVIKLLLKKGANVNNKYKDGTTPLHWASRYGEVSVVELMLEKGAKVNIQDRKGNTPLNEAVHIGNASIVQLLLNYGADVYKANVNGLIPLHGAVCSGNISVVTLLLSQCAEVNAQDEEGNTPLHYAMRARVTEIVRLILLKNADFDRENKSGITPLHMAIRTGNTSNVEFVYNEGAKGNDQNKNRNTPLTDVVFGKTKPFDPFISITNLMMKRGVNINKQHRDGITLPNWFVFAEVKSVVRLLLQRGAKVNTRDELGNTPLHDAVHFGMRSIVEMLLDNRADINVQKNDGETPLHIAIRHENTELASLLVRSGANVTLRNDVGDTPLSYALMFSFKDNVKIIDLLKTAEKNTNDNTLCKSKNFNEMVSIFNLQSHPDFCLQNDTLIEYLKSSKSPSLLGQLYETKLLSMIFIRALNHPMIEHEVLLGTNVDEIDALDDVCLRYREKGQHRPVVLFVQAKHKEINIKSKLTDEALWDDSGDFDLRKYFKSYLTIRNRFQAVNDDSLFEGKFCDVDCYFILYTSAVESLTSKKTDNTINETVHNLINTAEQYGYPFQYKYDEADLHKLTNLSAKHRNTPGNSNENDVQHQNSTVNDMDNERDFFNRLWFYCKQAKENDVEQIVKYEINKHYKVNEDQNCLKYELHSKSIFLKVHKEIQKWWMLNEEAPYLSRSDDYFSQARQACFDDVIGTLINTIQYFKMSIDLKLSQYQLDTHTEIPKTTIKLCTLNKVIDLRNKSITIDIDLNNDIVKQLLSNEKYVGLKNSTSENKNLDSNIDLQNIKIYKKRDGTSEVGALFRIKMICLVNLRLLNHDQIDQHFILGANIKDITFMSDICLRYRVKNTQRSVVLFTQLIYKEDPETDKLNIQKVWSSGGTFSFQKYFAIYRQIKDRFLVHNKDPMFEGNFRDLDCYFILYTTAKETMAKKKSENEIDQVVHDLLNTRPSSKPFQYKDDEADIDRLTKMIVMDQIKRFGELLMNFTTKEVYNPSLLIDTIIWKYHVATARDILQQSETQDDSNEYRIWRFRSKFLDSDMEYFVTLKQIFLRKLTSNRAKNSKNTDKGKRNVSKDEVRKQLEALNFKLPSNFGNTDMTFHGDEEVVGEKINFLVETLIDILKLNNYTEIVRVDHNMGLDKTIERGAFEVNDGIGGAVGNLLVLDANSNMLKFDLENKALPHNAASFLKTLKEKYNHIEQDLCVYRFEININGFPKYSFDIDEYNKKETNDFLSKLWFYPYQAKEDEITQIVNNEINEIYSYRKILQTNTFNLIPEYYQDEVQKWWIQTSKSPYLTRASGLLKRAELADIFTLLLNAIHFLFISNNNYSIDVDLTEVGSNKQINLIHRAFFKVVAELFRLPESQFDEHFKLRPNGYIISDRSTVSLKVHPEMEWVAMTVTTEYGPGYMAKHCFVIRAKKGFSIYNMNIAEHLYYFRNESNTKIYEIFEK